MSEEVARRIDRIDDRQDKMSSTLDRLVGVVEQLSITSQNQLAMAMENSKSINDQREKIAAISTTQGIGGKLTNIIVVVVVSALSGAIMKLILIDK